MLSGRYASRFWSAFNMESFLSFPAVGKIYDEHGKTFITYLLQGRVKQLEYQYDIKHQEGKWDQMGMLTDTFW